jgi:hypothetical protein
MAHWVGPPGRKVKQKKIKDRDLALSMWYIKNGIPLTPKLNPSNGEAWSFVEALL